MKLSEVELPEWAMCVLGLLGAIFTVVVLFVVFYLVHS
jgi:hypothetical protein